MANKRRLSLLISIVMVLVVAVVATPRIVLVELLETILSMFYEEETIYASGYSWRAWSEIRIGDTEDRVVKLMGEPLYRNQGADGRKFYSYSIQGPRNTNYRMRGISFDNSGRVRKKKAGFYFD